MRVLWLFFRRKKKKKVKENSENEDKQQEKKKESKKKNKKRKKRKQKKEKKKITKPSKLQLNVYNILFDELNLLLKETPKLSRKKLKERLILLDGKLLWIERKSELDISAEEETDDDIALEMEMLELGLDLDDAEEVIFEEGNLAAPGLDISSYKKMIEKQTEKNENLKKIFTEFSVEDLDKPLDDLEGSFVLFELRALIEKAVSGVFTIEHQISEIQEQEEQKEKIKQLERRQKQVLKNALEEALQKIQKEKPELILKKEKIKEYKKLTTTKIADMKAQEEKLLEEMMEKI
jgi:hypothetical protein